MVQDEPQIATTSYFEREFALQAVKVLPGEYFATADSTAISTLLGSCVSVCLFDRDRGVGGMNHFMLPKVLLRENATRCAAPYAAPCANPCTARYGNCAMKHLLERLELLGARRTNLEAKIFGGGQVMAGGVNIGEKNASFALGYLEERGIPVVASDVGDRCPRKLFFLPAVGRVFVKRLRKQPIGTF
jgi:chemotaxis protein CheD